MVSPLLCQKSPGTLQLRSDQTVLLRLLKDDFKNSPRISPNSQDYN